MEKIGWDGHEFPQSLLPTANFPCLPVLPFLLLPLQNEERKKEIAATTSATKLWILRVPKKSRHCSYTPRQED